MTIGRVLYIKEVKKNVFLYKESVVYPLVQFEPNYNQIFLVTINLLKF